MTPIDLTMVAPAFTVWPFCEVQGDEHNSHVLAGSRLGGQVPIEELLFEAIFPIEAAVVWIFAPFASILTYEFAKALTHHPQPTSVALFGSAGTHSRTAV